MTLPPMYTGTTFLASSGKCAVPCHAVPDAVLASFPNEQLLVLDAVADGASFWCILPKNFCKLCHCVLALVSV